MISDGLYTHASDVWAFGILAWELYTSFTAGQDRRDLSIPYYDLNDDEVNIKDTIFRSTFSTDAIVVVVVQFCFWFNLDFPLFDIHYHILA